MTRSIESEIKEAVMALVRAEEEFKRAKQRYDDLIKGLQGNRPKSGNGSHRKHQASSQGQTLSDKILSLMIKRDKPVHLKDLAQAIGRTTKQVGSILNYMMRRGIVRSDGKGFWQPVSR